MSEWEPTEPVSEIWLHEETETIPTNKVIWPDSSIALDAMKRKCGRKGRRKSGTKKHRAGRNQKRRYKPYYKMSVSERQKVDDRIEKRNSRRREYYHSCGLPLAPLNTTQFLLEDRPEPDLLLRKFEDKRQNFDNNSDLSSLSEYDGSDSESGEFDVMWKREGNEKYQNNSIQQLRQLYISLEDDIAEIERQREEGLTKIRIFQDEVRNYESTNEFLSKLNADLVKALEDMNSKVEIEGDKKDLPEKESSSADTV